MSDRTSRALTGNPAEAYESYFVPAIFMPWTVELLLRARPRVGERVLDLACGTGVISRHVAPILGPNGRIAALDISPAMLAVARTHAAPAGAPIRWQLGSALALPFPDNCFHLTLCQQSLQFFPDRPRALAEIRRVLMVGGRVALSVWQKLELHPVYEAMYMAAARRLNVPVMTLARPFSLPDADELYTLLADAGFVQVLVEPVTRVVQFPMPSHFVQMSLVGAAVVVPAFAEMDAEERERLIAGVESDIADTLRRFTSGETIRFPLAGHIAVACA